MKTDPIKRALELRETLISEDNKKVLVVKFEDTLQGKDTSKVIDLMPNIYTNEKVFRAKVNVKELDPIASGVYKVPFFDVNTKTDREIEDFIKAKEFDFPLWFKHHKDFSMKKVVDYNPPFILQVAGCNFHDGSASGGCWYCFVDDKSNDGVISKGKAFLSADETLDSMLAARKEVKKIYGDIGRDVNLKVLRTSGGEPTIALDWILGLWRKVSERNLDFVGQIDTNLSTGQVVDSFEKEGIYEHHILEKLAEHPIKILTALKGSDEDNLQSNVQSYTTMEAQKYSLKKIVSAGFDIFPQMYNPNPATLENFLYDMDSEIQDLSLKIHIGPLKVYGPTKFRLTQDANNFGINPEEVITRRKQEWDDNYKKSCEIIDNYLQETQGVGYKEVTRSDVKVKVLK